MTIVICAPSYSPPSPCMTLLPSHLLPAHALILEGAWSAVNAVEWHGGGDGVDHDQALRPVDLAGEHAEGEVVVHDGHVAHLQLQLEQALRGLVAGSGRDGGGQGRRGGGI